MLCRMRAATTLIALVLTVSPATAGCVVKHLPAVLCTGSGLAAQFGAFYWNRGAPAKGERDSTYVDEQGCVVIRESGLAVFPTGSRFAVQTGVKFEPVDVTRIEVDGLPPMYVMSDCLAGDCRRR